MFWRILFRNAVNMKMPRVAPYMIPAKALQFLIQLEHQMRWRIMAAEQRSGVVFMPQHSGMKHEITQNR